jgi:hypothetical protein
VAPDVISLRVRTGRMAEEMRTREGKGKGKESAAFAHGLGGEDVNTTADVRDSGEESRLPGGVSSAGICGRRRGGRGEREGRR